MRCDGVGEDRPCLGGEGIVVGIALREVRQHQTPGALLLQPTHVWAADTGRCEPIGKHGSPLRLLNPPAVHLYSMVERLRLQGERRYLCDDSTRADWVLTHSNAGVVHRGAAEPVDVLLRRRGKAHHDLMLDLVQGAPLQNSGEPKQWSPCA